MYEYKVYAVNRVVDGDTVDVSIDLGFNVIINSRIRLNGIDAPESRTRDLVEKEKGQESTRWLKYKLNTEKDIIIKTDKDGRGSFGRMLGTFFIDGVNINELMVSEGFAEEYKK